MKPKPPFAVSSTLIIIAPVFVAAGNYLLIGRLIRAVLSSANHRIFGIPAQLITNVFVSCDILSFLVQASGSGIASSGSWEGNEAKIGTNVLIGGLSTQVATFLWFLAIVFRFWQHTKSEVRCDAPPGWSRVLQAIWLSSALILVSLFCASLSNGDSWDGALCFWLTKWQGSVNISSHRICSRYTRVPIYP